MKNNKKSMIISLMILMVVLILCLVLIKNKLTYLEYTSINEQSDIYIEVCHPGEELVQEFIMPYDIIKGISIKIGTFARDNNSEWDILLKDTKNNEFVYIDHFNASLIVDNEYHYIKFDKNIELEKNSLYEIHIIANSVNERTGLAFYASEINVNQENKKLCFNNQSLSGSLCFKIYGGDIDYWWSGLAIFIALLIGFIIIRLYSLKERGKDPAKDLIIQSTLLGFAVFLLLFSFSVTSTFTDEFDNIRGGMIIAKGGVLYRDYVTQHTPIAYYLCAIFALLGAGSVSQFRLSYYIFEAIIWALLYFRHENYFGKRKMLALPLLESIFISSIVSAQGSQVLSDGLQGLCMVVLSLEFLRYYDDKKIDWIRSIIISVCIWGSFGSAFVSAYALIWLVFVVVVIEIKDWKSKKVTLGTVINRYWKLLIASITPLIGAILYFTINHSLLRAFRQFYTFNREVYSKYTGGMGEKLIQPFINAVQNFFNIIAGNFNRIINAQASNENILQLIIAVLATIVIILLVMDKRIIESFLLFMLLCCSATRDYGFHGLAAWYIAIMLITIFYEKLFKYLPNIGVPLTGIILIFMTSIYICAVGNNLLYEQNPISEIESNVISMTNPGEGVLIDAFGCDSIYFLYKDRYPVNRAVYMLPWYMDWFEQDTIDDLINYKPNIVIYYEDIDTWGHTHYANAFASVLKENYSQLSSNPDDGWKYSVWLKNNDGTNIR